jgi:anti-sigma regulatory factor (Ser/Thr protein kinase)
VATKAYKRVVEYHFEVDEEMIAITDVGKDYVCVEEVRKNGQEDTHMSGVLVATMDGKFVWEEGESMFIEYGSKELADGIRKHLNTHGFPGRRKSA